MYNFTGETCCACNNKFKNNDDVVVCPECGTPYHRECYAKEHRCLFEDKHAQGYEFTPEKNSAEKNRCANCGADNKKDALVCEHCGCAIQSESVDNELNLSDTEKKKVQPTLNQNTSTDIFNAVSFQTFSPEQLFGENIMAKKYDDISASEWAAFIGKNSTQYLMQFARMDKLGKKTSFCISALFVAPIYFLYRKMWFWAFVSFLVSLISNIPTTITVFQSMGLSLFSNISAQGLMLISTACSMFNIGMSVYFGLYAFYLYRQSAAKTIKQLQTDMTSVDAYHEKLAKAGAPSTVAVIVFLALMIALSYFIVLLVGPENILALYN